MSSDTEVIGLINCIKKMIANKRIHFEHYVARAMDKHFKKLTDQGIELGFSGRVIFPSLDEPTKTTGNDTYVPGLADALMLGEPYYSKSKGMTSMPSRGRDYTVYSNYKVSPPPVGWYMSEKFDGQRALWDGAKFVTRGSKSSLPRVYPYVPEWFIALMPPGICLDGEFYIDRNQFQELGFLKSKLKEVDARTKRDNTAELLDLKWINIKYQVFDCITLNKAGTGPDLSVPFEQRMETLKRIIAERCKVWNLIQLPVYLHTKPDCPMIYTEQYLIKSESELDKYYTELISADAEGVMLRAGKIPYLQYRTKLLLKLKPEEDAECTITGYKPGAGKYSGMLGSFECTTNKGKVFYVGGMNDTIRRNYLKTHPVGTVITYKYTFLTDAGIPRHPRYFRIYSG